MFIPLDVVLETYFNKVIKKSMQRFFSRCVFFASLEYVSAENGGFISVQIYIILNNHTFILQ